MPLFDPLLFDQAIFDAGPVVIWPGAVNVMAKHDWQTPSATAAFDPARATAEWGAAQITYEWGPA